MDDRELIAAAIAAGKLRPIPPGVNRDHPDWASLCSTDPTQTVMGRRIYYVMKRKPDTAYTVKSILREMSSHRIVVTGPTALDRFARARGAFEALAAHGIVCELPAVKIGGRRWKLLDGSRPSPTLKAMQEESRRLRAKHLD